MNEEIEVMGLLENGKWNLYYYDDYYNPMGKSFKTKDEARAYAEEHNYKVVGMYYGTPLTTDAGFGTL